MSDSESSYDDSDREEESEDSTLTSSDTDAEVKYLTFLNRGMRWPVYLSNSWTFIWVG